MTKETIKMIKMKKGDQVKLVDLQEIKEMLEGLGWKEDKPAKKQKEPSKKED